MSICWIRALLTLLLVSVTLSGETEESTLKQTVVACVGDSITFGARLNNPSVDSYPAQLQRLLGNDYLVKNHGVGGSTLLRKGIPTVWDQLPEIRASQPDFVVISLGTNDTCGMGTCGNRKCWEYWEEFENDYRDLIDTLYSFPTRPKIWICAPTPMVLETPGLSDDRVKGLTIRKPRLQKLISIIRQVAVEKHVTFIDLNSPLDHEPDLFTEKDGVHPNQKGYKTIAELVYSNIFTK